MEDTAQSAATPSVHHVVDDVASRSSPHARNESRGGRLARRSSSLGIATSNAVELVVTDPNVDENTLKILGNMAIDEERRSEMRRSFTSGKRGKRNSGSGTNTPPIATSTPRRSSMGSIDLHYSRDRLGHSCSLTSSITPRAHGVAAAESEEATHEFSGYDVQPSPVGSCNSTEALGGENSSTRVSTACNGVEEKVADTNGLPLLPLVAAHVKDSVDGKRQHTAAASPQGSDGTSASTRRVRLQRKVELLRQASLHAAGTDMADKYGESSPISPIPEVSVESMSPSPSSLPADPTPAEQAVSDHEQLEESLPTGPPEPPPLPPNLLDLGLDEGKPLKAESLPRRKTIAVVDEDMVELDEALDVIREQEQDITILHYQLEDMKDKFEELEMEHYENEQLLRQARDKTGRLQYDVEQKSKELESYARVGKYLEDLLQAYDVSVPKNAVLCDEVERQKHLEVARRKLHESVEKQLTEENKIASDRGPSSNVTDGRITQSSMMSLSTSLLSRVRTPEWLSRQRSPSPKTSISLSRESSVDPPDYRESLTPLRGQSPATSLSSATNRHIRLVRHSSVDLPLARSLNSTPSALVASPLQLAADAMNDSNRDNQSAKSVSSRSDTPDAQSDAVSKVSYVEHDHDYVVVSAATTPDRVSPSMTSLVDHDHDYITSGESTPSGFHTSVAGDETDGVGARTAAQECTQYETNSAHRASSRDTVSPVQMHAQPPHPPVSQTAGSIVADTESAQTGSQSVPSAEIRVADQPSAVSGRHAKLARTGPQLIQQSRTPPVASEYSSSVSSDVSSDGNSSGSEDAVMVLASGGSSRHHMQSNGVVTNTSHSSLSSANIALSQPAASASTISHGKISAGNISTGSISAGNISTGSISAGNISTGNIAVARSAVSATANSGANVTPFPADPNWSMPGALRTGKERPLPPRRNESIPQNVVTTAPGQARSAAVPASVLTRHEYTAAMAMLQSNQNTVAAGNDNSRQSRLHVSDLPTSNHQSSGVTLVDQPYAQSNVTMLHRTSMYSDSRASMAHTLPQPQAVQAAARHRPLHAVVSQPVVGSSHHGHTPSIDDQSPGDAHKSPYARRRISMDSLQPLEEVPSPATQPRFSVRSVASERQSAAIVNQNSSAAPAAKVETQV
ncbi:mucin-4-like [Sycon ciliatum]|uniref:mucin-4-like n=1 Tax=Sycon ciliatum TaxID=27933 RepID=UPI0031F6A83D